MATAMIYDTLKLAEQLEHEAGFDPARARAMARILAENTGGNLATRDDLLVVEAQLEAAIQALQFDLGARIAGMDVKIAGLDGKAAGIDGKFASMDGKLASMEGQIGELRGDIRVLYWMTGTTLAGVATLLGTAITIALHIMHLG